MGHRVLVAINDQPISLNASAGYQRWPGLAQRSPVHEFRATLGLSWGLQLR